MMSRISLWLHDFATTGAPLRSSVPQERVPSQKDVPSMKTRRRPTVTFWRSGAIFEMYGGLLRSAMGTRVVNRVGMSFLHRATH
jgi:hypothetical protein